MPLSVYDEVLAEFDKRSQERIAAALESLALPGEAPQIKSNVENETALSKGAMTELLKKFGEHLDAGTMALDAWKASCWENQLAGAELSEDVSPSTLGRVKSLDAHAASVATTEDAYYTGLTPDAARELLVKFADSPDIGEFESLMRSSMLGDYLIWATFDLDDPSNNPFDKLPRTHAALCTALGLGMFSSLETMIQLVWDHREAGTPALHRPTVADACDYIYFRPYSDSHCAWGFTAPLPPNIDRLPAQPEVVMPPTSCKGLKLPFRLVHP